MEGMFWGCSFLTTYYNIGTGETITYMGPLTLTDNVTVTAYATAEGYNTSETVTFKPIENGTRDGDTFSIRGEVMTDELLFLRTIYANFTTQPAADRIYTMNVGEAYDATHAEGSVFVQGQRAVRPFEAYTTSTNGARYIDLFGEEADGIVKIVNGKLKTDNYVYDLSGRRINANHRQSWPGKRLIIKNGKVSTQSY